MPLNYIKIYIRIIILIDKIVYLHTSSIINFFLDYEWEDPKHGQDLQSLVQDSCRKILLILVGGYFPNNGYQI